MVLLDTGTSGMSREGTMKMRIERLKNCSFEKELCVSNLPYFEWKPQTIKNYIGASFMHHRTDEYEWMLDLTLMLLVGFRESLFSFKTYFRGLFCYRTALNWSLEYPILYLLGPIGKNVTFCVPLGTAEFSIICELSIYPQIALLRTLLDH